MNNFSWQDSVYSNGNKEFLTLVKNKKGNFLKIKIRMYKINNLKIIYLITAPEGERIYTPMKIIKEEDFFQYWSVKIKLISRELSYKFMLIAKNKLLWFSQLGLSKITPLEHFDFRYYLDFKEIKWLNKSVFYQIFPDRFYDGNSQTNLKDNEYFYDNYPAKINKWGENPKDYKNGYHLDFFGGDLEGIKKKIPYFKALGINALYLNPIFLSPSNHKYDTQDYFQIDPHFGTNEEFANLVKLLHQNKISIILDGVFNHTGMAHYWFNKSNFYLKEGAYQNIHSPYGEYFTFYDYPEGYYAWRDVKTLPKLNYQSLKLRKVIYQAEDSAAKFWLKEPYNIDGWRLDVANMLARQGEFQDYKEVWREFRKEIKKVNQDAYILGEHFYDPGELLQGDMLDAVMNYQGFYAPLIRFLVKPLKLKIEKWNYNIQDRFNAKDFDDNLTFFRSQIGWQISKGMFNLLDCHDLPRFYTLANENLALFKLGVILLFTYLGIPCVYYGDEIGLKGENETQSRACMNWDKNNSNQDIFKLYKTLIKLRKNSPALYAGGIKTIYKEGNIYAFTRFYKKECLIIIINNNNQNRQIKFPLWTSGIINKNFKEIFSGLNYQVKNGYLTINLNKYQGLILY